MEAPEVPVEHAQEVVEHARETMESWIMGVALTAALLAVLAAITALMAEHHANEAMISQIQASDQWNYYQAKGIKASVVATKLSLMEGLGKTASQADLDALAKYERQKEEIAEKAKAKEEESEAHLTHHRFLAFGVTLFQVAIAVSAIAVLTKRRLFWFVAGGFGSLGVAFLVYGIVL